MVAREGIAGCRSPKSFRRPFNVVTRSFLKYRLRVCAITLIQDSPLCDRFKFDRDLSYSSVTYSVLPTPYY